MLSYDSMKNTRCDVFFILVQTGEGKIAGEDWGSCWSPSTLGVSLSVIIFHACHVDQIYTTCVLFIRPPRVM